MRYPPQQSWVGHLEMCSGSEAGSYLRLIDFVCHSTLGLRVIKKKREGNLEAIGEGKERLGEEGQRPSCCGVWRLAFRNNYFAEM